MRKRERSKRLKHLLEVKGSIQYLKEMLAANEGLTLAIIRKNLHYAILKEEELCKKTGFGDLTNLSTTSQRLEGKV